MFSWILKVFINLTIYKKKKRYIFNSTAFIERFQLSKNSTSQNDLSDILFNN